MTSNIIKNLNIRIFFIFPRLTRLFRAKFSSTALILISYFLFRLYLLPNSHLLSFSYMKTCGSYPSQIIWPQYGGLRYFIQLTIVYEKPLAQYNAPAAVLWALTSINLTLSSYGSIAANWQYIMFVMCIALDTADRNISTPYLKM